MTEQPSPAEEPAEEPRRDRWRPMRRSVAQVVIAFTILFLVPFIRVIIGAENGPKVVRGPAEWTVWLASLALMVVAALCAVRALQADEQPAKVKLTRLAGGLWLAGFVVNVVYSSMLEPAA